MSAIILKFLIVAAIFAFIYFGIRKIWRDWTGAFKADDTARRTRDLNERQRPDVIDLKRDADGVYRPPEDRDRR